MARRFAQIPEFMLYDKRLPAQGVRVYGVLLREARNSDSCTPTQERIAELCGVSVDTVQRAIRTLVALGYVVQQRRGRTESNLYKITHAFDCAGASTQLCVVSSLLFALY